VRGQVVTVGGDGIPAAGVRVGRTPIVLAADEEGFFRVDVSVSEAAGDALVVAATADGYTDGAATLPASPADIPALVTITLKPVAVEVTVEDPSQGVTAETPGARLTIPGGVLPTTNRVQLEFTPLDPTQPEGAAYPGQNFLAAAPAGAENNGTGRTMLESVVLAEVRATDLETGELLTDLDGLATIELRLPDAQQGAFQAGDRVPWWFFDEETGLWQQDGEAEIFVGPDGALWARATARHFTWWNVDQPVSDHTCFKARFVRNSDGTVLTGLEAFAEGVTYSGTSPARVSGYDTADGVRSCFTTKRSSVATETVRLSVTLDGRRWYLASDGAGAYDLVDGTATATAFPSPTVAASCYQNVNTANCGDLGDLRLDVNLPPRLDVTVNHAVACPSRPTVSLDVDAVDPEGDDPIVITFTPSAGTVSPARRWELPTTPGAYSVRVDATDSLGKTSSRTVSVRMQANCPPEIETFDVPSPIDPHVTPTAILSATATDPDAGQTLTYRWNVGGVVFDGASITWPVKGSYWVWVELVVSDGIDTAYRSGSIEIVNEPPSILGLSTDPPTLACEVGSFTVTANALDSDGDTVSYRWSASTGNIVDVDQASTTWTTPAGVTFAWVRVEASDPFGGSTVRYAYVGTSNHFPTVTVAADPAVVAPGGTVSLTAVADDDDGSIAAHQWSAYAGALVPDDDEATWTAPPQVGAYWISDTVTDDCGAQQTGYTRVDVVLSPPPPAPGAPCSAALAVSPSSGTAPLGVVAAAYALGLDSSFPTYEWDFDDGTPVVTTFWHQVFHFYGTPGTFDPVVRVTDTDGTCQATQSVNVAAPTSTTTSTSSTTTTVTTTTGITTTSTFAGSTTTTTTSTTTTTTLPPIVCGNPDGGPDELTLTIGPTGSDSDIGIGTHNFPWPDATLSLCLRGCDLSTDDACVIDGAGSASPTGAFLGTPGLFTITGFTVCLQNRYDPGSVSGAFVLSTGDLNFDVPITTDVHLFDCSPANLIGSFRLPIPFTTGTSSVDGPLPCAGQTADDACPIGGSCTGQCTGTACVTTVPDPSAPGSSICRDERGGLSQLCCDTSTATPCFPTAGGGTLARTGRVDVPGQGAGQAWPEPTYPKSAAPVLGGVFCIPSTGSGAIDATSGVPGPGAAIWSTSAVVRINP
jgi:hypothetical protein